MHFKMTFHDKKIRIKQCNSGIITIYQCIRCSFKFPVKAGVEESIVNARRIVDDGSADQM
jgi:hypothetical protein